MIDDMIEMRLTITVLIKTTVNVCFKALKLAKKRKNRYFISAECVDLLCGGENLLVVMPGQ